MHRYIFQDVYEWAGEIRVINIEKSEPTLGTVRVFPSRYGCIFQSSAKYFENVTAAFSIDALSQW